jgi:hypothetical protein
MNATTSRQVKIGICGLTVIGLMAASLGCSSSGSDTGTGGKTGGAGSTGAGTGGSATSGVGGSTGDAGPGSTFNFTFETDADFAAWPFDTFQSPNPVDNNNPYNLAAAHDAGGTTVPTRMRATSGGNPGGAYQIDATFSDFYQVVTLTKPVAVGSALQDWTGKVISADVKIASTGAFTGQAGVYVQSGATYNGFQSTYKPINSTTWTAFTLSPTTGTGFDATMVIQFAVQIQSGSPGDSGVYGSPQPVTVLIDNIKVTP